MKKLAILLMALVLVLGSFATACSNGKGNEGDGGDNIPPVCEHVQTQATNYYIEDAGSVYSAFKCTACSKHLKSGNAITATLVSSDDEFKSAQSSENAVIFVKAGTYENLNVIASAKGVKIISDVNAKIARIDVAGGAENLTFEGLIFAEDFYGGIVANGDVKQVKVLKCDFSKRVQIYFMQKVTDLVVEDCSFKNIYDGDRKSAIVIAEFVNLTVKDCFFDYVEQNALHIGADVHASTGSGSGIVVITGNSFKQIGSAVLDFAVTNASECDISNNYFEDKSLATMATDKYYVDAEKASGIVVGVNKWQVIPEANNDMFNGYNQGNVYYNVNGQEQA